MKTKTLTKKLCIAGVLCLITALLCSQAFAWDGVFRREGRLNKGDQKWNRLYRPDCNRFDRSGFFDFRIGDVIVRLPITCQVIMANSRPRNYCDGVYCEKYPHRYIIIPGSGK